MKKQEQSGGLAPVRRVGKCSICGSRYMDHGNNAWPVNNGRCCSPCNWAHVIPARLMRLRSEKLAEEAANDSHDQ